MEDQRLEQVTLCHKCSLTSSICFSHIGFCFVFFCFWFHECIVFPLPLLQSGQIWMRRANPITELLCSLQDRSAEPQVPWPAVTSKHWLYFSSSVVVPRQLSLLYTSSPSFQGIITQPSKYQNMLWFETWCTESQAPEWLWFTSKFKKILSLVGYLFTVFKYVCSVF